MPPPNDEPEFRSPLQALFGRRRARARKAPLDDGSTLDVRCPRCEARLRARCGRTNRCPRCGENVTVAGADVARSAMPLAGDRLTVRRSRTSEETVTVAAPVLVVAFDRPWYLVRLRGAETGWVTDDAVRLVSPRR